MAQIKSDGVYKVTDANGNESQMQFTKGHEVGDLEVERVGDFPTPLRDRTVERLEADAATAKSDAAPENKAASAPANKTK